MAKPSPSYAGNPALVAIGRTVRRLRREQGVSQEQLALLAEIDRSYVGGIERGEHNLTVITLVRLAKVLSVSPADLMQQSG